MPPCLILAEETWGSTLHAARSLGSLGVCVYVATAGMGARIYGRSRHCVAAKDFDPADPHMFCAEVIRWAENQITGSGPVLIVPTSDRLVEFLHRFRGEFPGRFLLALPAPEVTAALLDKVRACEMAEQAGLRVPSWVSVMTPEDIFTTDRLEMPVAVRPRVWSGTGREYFKLDVYRDRSELQAGLRRRLEEGASLLVQEYVEGPDEAVEWAILYGSPEGCDLICCTGRKMRQAGVDGGVMVWGQSVVLPELMGDAASFVRTSGFTGLGGLEMKQQGGQRFFIEFNPRLEAIHFLAARAGIDTLQIAYRDLALGQPPGRPRIQDRATGMVGNAWLARFIQTLDGQAAIADLVRFFLAPRKVCAIWSWRDPLPWLVVMWHLLTKLLRRDRGRQVSQ